MDRLTVGRALIGYLLRVTLSDRLILTFGLLLTAGTAFALFLGSTALVEKREFAAVLIAAIARLVVVVALVLVTCFQLRRAFDTRDVDLLLSRPISRPGFVVAQLTTAMIFVVGAALLAGLVVGLVARPQPTALGIWTLTLLVEGAIVVAAALFFALALTSGVASTLATLGLYVLARVIGLISGIAAAQANTGPLGWVVDLLVAGLVLILPRLDLLVRSDWLVHGVDAELGLGVLLIQGLVYTALLAAAASFDFERRQL